MFSAEGSSQKLPTMRGGPLRQPYRLEQMHLHWLSEHAIDGAKYVILHDPISTSKATILKLINVQIPSGNSSGARAFRLGRAERPQEERRSRHPSFIW